MSEGTLDEDRSGQLRQRVRVLRVLVAARGDAAERLADLELKIRHARVCTDDVAHWIRALDDTIDAIESGAATERQLEDIIEAIAAGLHAYEPRGHHGS